MTARLVVLTVLLTGCASIQTGNVKILPAALQATARGSNTVEIQGDPEVVRRELSRALATSGFKLTDSPEPSVLQAEGVTVANGEATVRVSFLLSDTGATGRAWFQDGAGPGAAALRRSGIPVSDAYRPAVWGDNLYGDQAFAKLAEVASAVPGVSVRAGR